jgi:hypothetical protein
MKKAQDKLNEVQRDLEKQRQIEESVIFNLKINLNFFLRSKKLKMKIELLLMN